jgi:hypothetical protein
MRYLFLILFTVSLNAQILPSQQATHYKKNSVSEPRAFNNCGKTGYDGPSQSDCNTAYASSDLNGEVTVTSGIQYWTVPATGTYTITAIGATAGNTNEPTQTVGFPSQITGDFSLNQGDVVKILVGQRGWMTVNTSNYYAWGGGGGTFVTKNDNTILVIAGGTGSAHFLYNASWIGPFDSQSASLTISGNAAPGNNNFGTNGGGGSTGKGGDAAGYSGNGTTGNNMRIKAISGMPNHSVPQSFLNGGAGDAFGGGFGGAGGNTSYWGGGGGGYSGGAGGISSPYYAGGGGSKNNGSNQTNILKGGASATDTNTTMSDGSVTITW